LTINHHSLIDENEETRVEDNKSRDRDEH